MSAGTGFELREAERFATGVRYRDGRLSLRASPLPFGGVLGIAVSIVFAVTAVRSASMEANGSAMWAVWFAVAALVSTVLGVRQFQAGLDATTTKVVARASMRTWRFECGDVAEVRLASRSVRGSEQWYPIIELTSGTVIPLVDLAALKGPSVFTLQGANLARLKADVLQRFFVVATRSRSGEVDPADRVARDRLSRNIEDPADIADRRIR